MQLALDTNILAYAEGVGDDARHRASIELIEALPFSSVIIPAQCLGELFHVLTRKERRAPASVQEAILGWVGTYEIAGSTWTAFQSAIDAAASHYMQIWDALILAVAAERHCRLLLSEDMQHGFTWHGVTVINPYTKPKHQLLHEIMKY